MGPDVIKFLDLQAQYQSIKGEIDAAMAAVIREAAFVGGETVQRFERRFAAYHGQEHCIGVANGTDAIEVLLEALGLPPRSEVIVPALSFIASSEAVTRAGHQVVFGDVDHGTYNLDPRDVERRITGRTAAILAVHLYGQPCDLSGLAAVAERHGVLLVEDCAQAHGAEFRGRRVGTFGVGGTFSFYPGKNLGAYGDAGAIVTGDSALAQRCRMIANHGRTDKYNHRLEGRNSRLDGLQAAILEVKLQHLDKWVDRRNAVARAYRAGLTRIQHVVLPQQRDDVRHAYHLFVIRSSRRDALAQHLKQRGVQTGIHYPIALPQLEAYAHLGQAEAPLFANRLGDELLSLPMGEHLSDEDVATVCRHIAEFTG
jgi:dTDP-4-amino-4,6-dideoxygalactose transaminase